MRVASHSGGRLLGYVEVKVASRVFLLPVESRPLALDDGAALRPGFFGHAAGTFGILVDSEASDAVIKETIERASEDAARHISRSVLN